MRRSFADILKNNNVDIKREYSRLYNAFYKEDEKGYSIYESVNDYFEEIWFRGTCSSLDEFDEQYGFKFDEQPQNFDLDYLILFCEYIYNITDAVNLQSRIYYEVGNKVCRIGEQVRKVVEMIEYISTRRDDFVIFIPNNMQAIQVAENVSENLSYKILEYNHHSLKGNLEGKKSILIKIAEEIEPQRKILRNIDSSLEKELFFAFNSFNIRHNNCYKRDSSKYIQQIDNLNETELEQLYDAVYNKSLIAFLKLENIPQDTFLKDIKKKIENKIS